MTKGCATEGQFLSVYEGMTKKQVLGRMGEPFKIESDEDGRATWMYTGWNPLSRTWFVEFDADGVVDFTWL
jgi:outer membrane protein assembly factor BamE (lipoprotein component of BamABCDE complex)